MAELRLEVLHGRRGQHLAEKEGAEPSGALPDHRAERDLRVGLVERLEAAHLVEVLGLFLHDRVDHVVHRDRAEQVAVLVHHRHRQEIVLGQESRDVLAVRHRGHLEEPAMLADLQDRGAPLRDHELPQRDDVHDPAVAGVQHVDGVDGLAAADVRDVVQRLPGGRGRRHAQVVGRHDPARGGRRKCQEQCQRRARRGIEVFEESGAVGVGKPAEEVGLLIRRHGLDERDRLVGREVMEHLRATARS